ncbi:MAG: hypothetical protein U0892_01035 [Pirellulales bacterium]
MRKGTWLSICLLAVACTGCSMCDTAHICDYAGAGGKWQRGYPACGRVGSNLSDAGESEQIRVSAGEESFGNGWEELQGVPTPVEPAPAEPHLAPVPDPMAFDDADLLGPEVPMRSAAKSKVGGLAIGR